MIRFFMLIIVAAVVEIVLGGCAPVKLSTKATYLSSPPHSVHASKIRILEQERVDAAANSLLSVSVMDMIRQWSESAFECSGTGKPLNIEIVESNLAPEQGTGDIYVATIDAKVFFGKNPLESSASTMVYVKVSRTIPTRCSLHERKTIATNLLEEAIDQLHTQVVRYIETHPK